MTIRARLLILLLATALIPLALTSLTHQISIRMVRHRLTANTRNALDTNARQALLEHLQGYVEVLTREQQLARALLNHQAREIELALSRTTEAPITDWTENSFGFDPNLTIGQASIHPAFQDGNDPNVAKLNIDYQRQGFSIFPRSDWDRIVTTQKKLARLTSVYRDIYQQAPSGTLWLKTYLRNGLMTRYPAAARPVPRFDQGYNRTDMRRRPDSDDESPGFDRRNDRLPDRERSASLDASDRRRRTDRDNLPRIDRRRPSRVDDITGLVVSEMSQPIFLADNTVIGYTSISRTIPEIFANMALPERWGLETQRMLIQVDANDLADANRPPQDAVRIMLRSDLDQRIENEPRRQRRGRWRRPRISTGELRSADTTLFQAMLNDIVTGRAGVEKMDSAGSPCLWAYQPLDIAGVAALIIVPYTQVTQLAQTMEQSLLQESFIWLQITTVVLILAAGLAIVLAIVRARGLTDPIGALIGAGRKLASGDYDARVHISADDEIGQLGRVFNDIGPKLKERESMKQSLELARIVQQSLLPKTTPTLQHFDIAGHCLYCEETGGDYYDFIDLSAIHTGQLSIVLGDVSGHGVSAALLMASIRGIMQTEVKHCGSDLVRLMDSINRQVLEDTTDDKFVTLFHGILDDRTRSFIWSSAGHEPAIWLHKDRITELPNTGMPVGVMADAVFEQAGPVILAKDDVLVIGTDGIWEALNEHHAFFGKERFHRIIREHATGSAQQICAAVIREVTAFIGTGNRTDDITLVAIKAR